MKLGFCIFLIGLQMTGLECLAKGDAGKQKGKCGLCIHKEHSAPAPYHFSFKRELPYLVTGVGLTVSSLVLQNNNPIKPYKEHELEFLDRNDVNSFDRPATYNWNPRAAQTSDIVRTGVVLLPAIFLANHHTRQDFGALLVMALEVGTINYGLTTTVKNMVNRFRPFVYNEEAPLEDRTGSESRLSYYSGHTSHTAAFSFFFAKVIHDYHPDMGKGSNMALWSFAAVIPAITGYLRFEAGKHYPTDIMSGYVLGALTGVLVPHFHKKPLIKSTSLKISPVFFAGSTGLHLNLKF